MVLFNPFGVVAQGDAITSGFSGGYCCWTPFGVRWNRNKYWHL